MVWSVLSGLSCFCHDCPVERFWVVGSDGVEVFGDVEVGVFGELSIGQCYAESEGSGYGELL